MLDSPIRCTSLRLSRRSRPASEAHAYRRPASPPTFEPPFPPFRPAITRLAPKILPVSKLAFSPVTAEAGTWSRRRTSKGVNALPASGILKSSSPTVYAAVSFEDYDHNHSHHPHMSLDHNPSPRPDGGWSSPGLSHPYEETNGLARNRGAVPVKGQADSNGGRDITWATAKANSAKVNGHPSYQSRNTGFFTRNMRRLSESLPYASFGGQDDRFAEKEKLGRGRVPQRTGSWPEWARRTGLLMSRRRKPATILILLVLMVLAWFYQRETVP